MGPCCVEGCDVTSEDTYYFEFPTSRLLRKKWLEVIPIAGKLPLGTVVCSRHFSAEDYENVRGKVRLKRKVVPSLMLDENTAKPLKSPAKELDPCDSTTVSVPSPETERNEDRLEARPDDFKHDDVKQADVKQDDVRQADVKQDDVRQADVKQADVKQDDVKQDDVKQDDVKQDDVKQDDTKIDDTPVKTRRCKPYEAPFATYWGMPRSSEILKSMVLENGMVETISKAKSPVPDPKEDIEDMITNYQIKNKIPNTALLTEPTPTECVDTIDTIEIPPDAADERPVFIEICVDKDKDGLATSRLRDVAVHKGPTEQQQLILISQLCGSCTPDVWPGVEGLDLYNKMELPKGQKRKVKERLKPYVKDPYGCDLLDKLLQLDPAKRYDADTALNHDFFWTDPMPCDLANMLAQHTQSMFEYLAPPRRPGHLRHHHHVAGAQPKPTQPVQDSGYQDRVF